ncbi:hypothetical protein EHS13_10090 [Paenibacillus psychroresistens]|uniref:Beta-galactosidase trimerisation domain-containing protein n=1 Tax=Paenibacillus psychroresistens TaxID=1778678 RepID=A0A6B8RI32_9BACL|nr:hypothetical protein [Paenibacillus psychroresistens]QGQ95212.1 hypothetical protein EHS13_10090 [Paenibacillus psychroresistens]
MERGIYFDGWYRDEHCYHPSLPMRRTQMVEDLVDYEATLLVWSALGGGVVSLPYLEEEAYGDVSPRLRMYGYMNDKEFIRECGKHGIKVFGVVFEVQGWSFPAEISEDETELLSLNIMRGEGKKVTYGLREFSQDKYPKLFKKSFRDYFPEGLVNSDGEQVTDIWEDCAARKLDGTAVHAQWVEIVGHEQQCYQMCRNNQVWRAYLKKIIEIQIDAGVHGVHLDECELPITAIGYGGCFCKDCMKQFNVYLIDRQVKGDLPSELQQMNLSAFHYGNYLNSLNAPFPGKKSETPFFTEYFQFQMKIMTGYFKELTDHIREYGRSQGREVLVSGNFFHVMHQYMPLQAEVDIIATEMRNTLYRQAYWYRYANGFANGKPMTVVENPYGGIVPELLENLRAGRMAEQFQLMLLEATTFGCNLSVPYGGWMGNTIRDAFYAPKEPTQAVQQFLKKQDHLLSDRSGAEIVVNYSYPSYYSRENDAVEHDPNQATMLSSTINKDVVMPFWDIIKEMSKQHVPFDVIISDDGDLFQDEFTLSSLQKYKCLVLPDNNKMTVKQLGTILEYLNKGGRVVVYGRLADEMGDPELAAQIIAHPGTAQCNLEEKLFGFVSSIRNVLPDAKYQIEIDGRPDIGINPHRLLNGGNTVHLVNYQFDREQDRVIPLDNVTFRFRTEVTVIGVKLHTITDEKLEPLWSYSDGYLTVTIESMPLYVLVECITGNTAGKETDSEEAGA